MHKFFLYFAFSLFITSSTLAQNEIEHYVFFNRDRDRIMEKSFIENEAFTGAQLKYTWRELEPEEGKYNFGLIEKDLKYLSERGKKLFIQLQEVSFDTAILNVPDYIRKEDKYHGGVAIQYLWDNKGNIIKQDGFVPRRWDKTVAARFHALIRALGVQFDGRLAGINFPETAIGLGEKEEYYPEGYNPEIYRGAIKKQMTVSAQAFQKTTIIQYANFMPGEWLPWEDKGYLSSLFAHAAELGIGMGGPDIKIYKKAQMNHSYKFLKAYAGQIKTGVAVQWGNYEEINPKTGKRVTIEEIYRFAKEEVGLDIIFWSTQEPFYGKDLMDFLKN